MRSTLLTNDCLTGYFPPTGRVAVFRGAIPQRPTPYVGRIAPSDGGSGFVTVENGRATREILSNETRPHYPS